MNWLLMTARVENGNTWFWRHLFNAVFTLLLSSPYHKPRLKKLLEHSGGRKRPFTVYFLEKVCCLYGTQEKNRPDSYWMDFKDPSAKGWFQNIGTGQHFCTYFELMRYVEYAKNEGLGIYSPSCKSIKRIKSLEKENQKKKESLEKDSTVIESRKTSSILSVRRKPSSESNSSTVEQRMDSQSSTSSESSDRDKDQDYVPESESNVTADSESGDPDFEVNQVLNEELDGLKSDDSTSD